MLEGSSVAAEQSGIMRGLWRSLQQSCPVARALFWRRAAAAELKNITVWLNRPHPRQLCLTASELGLLPWRCQRPGLLARALFQRCCRWCQARTHPWQFCLTASELGLLPRRCQRPGLITAKPCSVAQALIGRRQARSHPRQFCLTASKLGLLPWHCQRPGLRCRGFRLGHVLQCPGLRSLQQPRSAVRALFWRRRRCC